MAKEKKSKYEHLLVKQKSAWEIMTENEKKTAFKMSEDYKKFLDEQKTERQIVAHYKKEAEKKGFVDINKASSKDTKIFAINHDKNILLIDLGKNFVETGFKIIGSHIDSLRLDLKLSPVYESDQFVLLNLHYYGGIKKYHWLNLPMTLQGVIFTEKGKRVEVSIGNKENEPIFVIPDLMPHLEDREEKKASDIIKGEAMDAIAGSIPINDKNTKEKIKIAFLDALNKKYGIIEEDFVSADLSLFPAAKARDVGLDEGIIGAPAHDDRVCSYLAMKSFFESKEGLPKMVLLIDKEEIGSVGNTSMRSKFLENTLNKIIRIKKINVNEKELLEKSMAISGDVTSGLDPKYADKMDLQNVNKLGFGVAFEKGTGYGGKYSGSEANAELLLFVRQLMKKNNVPWQYGTIGKVDQGGGGTIAHLLAKYNMNIIDAGPPVLAMHSPFELISKADFYSTYKAYKVFFESKG